MDPLSITASILTILGATESVGKAIIKLVSLRQLPDAFLALNNEISDFHLVMSRTNTLIRLCQNMPSINARNADFATDLGPLLERGKARLLELECLIEYSLTTPGSNGESVLNKPAWIIKQEKVKRIQDDIRSMRTSLAVFIGLFVSSTTLTTEVQVSELRLIGSEILAQQRRNHAQVDRILARQTNMEASHERTQLLLQELLRTQAATRTVSNQTSLSSVPSSILGSVSTTVDRWWTLRLYSLTRTTVSGCNKSTCRCHCHNKFASPNFLKRVLGLLFLGYSGVPVITSACNENRCRRSVKIIVSVRYCFPARFMARVLEFSLRVSASGNVEQILRVSAVLPLNHKIYDIIDNGDVEGVKEWLGAYKGSPFAVDSQGQTLLDVGFLLHSLLITRSDLKS